ncbi:MAG TPA: nucleotidyltransferase family protein [Candidatus Woesearchaeota archaeon]|nr:nucleotidyltransferase family protein [Candidatus Woesearchaeota archaeon]
MKAIILAGGLGTRLRPVTLEIPKPLIPINGKTLTEHVINILLKADVREVYLSIGYMHEKIKHYFEDGSRFGIKIKYIVETQPLGTGGWMHLINKQELSEDFFVLNGDNLFDLNLKDFLEFHKNNNALASIALTQVEDVSKFGIVELKDKRITQFVEKPSPKNAPSSLANAGYYVFSPDIFNILPSHNSFSLERELFPKIAQLEKLYGYPCSALWFDTGTFESWEKVIHNWKHK